MTLYISLVTPKNIIFKVLNVIIVKSFAFWSIRLCDCCGPRYALKVYWATFIYADGRWFPRTELEIFISQC